MTTNQPLIIGGLLTCIVLGCGLLSLAQAQDFEEQNKQLLASHTQLNQLKEQEELSSKQTDATKAEFEQLSKDEEKLSLELKQNYQKEQVRLQKKKQDLTIQVEYYQDQVVQKRDQVKVIRDSQDSAQQGQFQSIEASYSDRLHQARELAVRAGRKIVEEHYLNGTNISVSLLEYNYAPSSDSYDLKVSLSWNGALLGWGNFSADGDISVKANGQNLIWNPTWLNQELKDSQSDLRTTALAIGVAVSLGSLSE